MLVLWDWGIRTDGCIPLSLSLALPTFFNNNNNSMGYRSNPQGAEWLEAEGDVERFGPTPSRVGVHPPRRGAPDRCHERRFLAGGVLECNLANRRSVSVLHAI